jgi:D-3-phosphoglycerate dehydrogenase
MKVMLADALTSSATSGLRAAGFEVVEAADLSGDALRDAVADQQPDVLVVRSTRVGSDVLQASRTLELVVRAGAGFDTIDTDDASSRGIFVANCPGKNASAVAELTFGLILALDRRIPDNVADARAGHWNKGLYSKASGLKGRTLGLVGFGSIGQEVARRARGFGMKVIVWSRSLTPEAASESGVLRVESALEVAGLADVVSLHVAATPETTGLAGRSFFQAMKEGAYFINTTRASVVDESALVWALEARGIRAALDVFSDEPAAKSGPLSHPLAARASVYLTHHIGASTEQAQDAIADEALRVIKTYRDTGDVLHCVNLAKKTQASHQITVRHVDKVGVLAAVLDRMRVAGWNVQEMENMVFEGSRAACAVIRFAGEPAADVMEDILSHEEVLAATIIKI